MNKIAIKVENIHKKFRIFHDSPLTFQRVVYSFLKGKKNYEDIWALKGVDFSLNKAEAVGLIGPNASGKTTLLRIIASIYTPTYGSVYVNGRITACLELVSGFLLEFTGLENLYLCGAVLGLSRKQIKAKIPQIIQFSELNGFLDAPLRQYSAGMKMRLAFSLMVNLNPDILLIDEILAVGDLSFREKCLKKIKELREEGKTLLLVSHNIDEIEELCDRVILLDKGQIRMTGSFHDVVGEFKTIMQSR